MPLVSVVMPAHDAAGTLTSSIRSVQAQSHPDWELLVTDDGSTDQTWTILSEAARLDRSEEHTSELQSRGHLVCRLLLGKKNRLDLPACSHAIHCWVLHGRVDVSV